MIETRGRVPATIHPTAFVATGAIVLGDVTLAARSSVWFNTVVRGDSAPIEIGEDTNVQDNSVVHVDEGKPALLGARVTVGHRTIVHGCVIEDDCLIGMGSVLLTGARIRSGSLVGAGSLVREGQEIPAGSLAVGAPARVVGPVGPAHVEAIRNGASHYAELARTYRGMGFSKPADRRGAVVHDRPPMGTREWEGLIDALESAPEMLTKVSRDRSSRLAGLVHGMERLDRVVRLPILAGLLAGEDTELPEGGPPPALRAETPLANLLQACRETRRLLCRTLRPMGPDEWRRVAGHRRRGPLTLSDLLREWVEEDAERRRELEAPDLGTPG